VDRVREAVEIAREHMRWCSHNGITAAEMMALVGMKDPGPRRVEKYGSLRLAALASKWLELPMTAVSDTVKKHEKPRKTSVSRIPVGETGVVSAITHGRIAA
jgi:hypothetical protein